MTTFWLLVTFLAALLLLKLPPRVPSASLCGVYGVSLASGGSAPDCKRVSNLLPTRARPPGSARCPGLFLKQPKRAASRAFLCPRGREEGGARQPGRWSVSTWGTEKKKEKRRWFYSCRPLLLYLCPLVPCSSVCAGRFSEGTRSSSSRGVWPVAGTSSPSLFLVPRSLPPRDSRLSRRVSVPAISGKGLPPQGLYGQRLTNLSERGGQQIESGPDLSREDPSLPEERGRRSLFGEGGNGSEKAEHEGKRDAREGAASESTSTPGPSGREEQESDCLPLDPGVGFVKKLLSNLLITKVPRSRLLLLRLPSKIERRQLQADPQARVKQETKPGVSGGEECGSRQTGTEDECTGTSREGRRQLEEAGEAGSHQTLTIPDTRQDEHQATQRNGGGEGPAEANTKTQEDGKYSCATYLAPWPVRSQVRNS